ncbi:hypothetical protein [Streptomyces zagrosensis]|uniref:3-hydroxymyristoyl/3-hydroxydecanoyl-(Acyl carrier protein) dehydratase n=1 Tax=Streptomyces zagrosensis TaxID=1042984 RepID=A0A7W9QHN6_9ACTN|nr:hypothetical protein [Streptomyces zagrosensis]MBB5940159.1 3-hydroxymyristoyl/3-hydroxydecanoyl-(acyl carrier protein) dehydratase [Streptomyces zagrosensis]
MVTVNDKLSFAAPLRAVDHVELTQTADGTRLRSTKVVRESDPYMAGHFPDLTMLPAVFLLEGVRQAVAEAFALSEVPELLEVRSVRLQAPMLGGDEITVDAVVRAEGEHRWFLDARCTRQDGTPVARLKLLVGVATGEQPLTSTHGPLTAPEPVTGPPIIGHARIRELLPVRHPMLLVDGVVAVEPGRLISGVKAISGSDVCYQNLPDGLPGERYSFPRSLIFESFGQTSALLWLATAETGGPDSVLMLAAIRGCRFVGDVQPGEVLRHVVRLEQLVADSAFMSGEIWAADRCVAVIDSLIAVARPRTAVQAPR